MGSIHKKLRDNLTCDRRRLEIITPPCEMKNYACVRWVTGANSSNEEDNYKTIVGNMASNVGR